MQKTIFLILLLFLPWVCFSQTDTNQPKHKEQIAEKRIQFDKKIQELIEKYNNSNPKKDAQTAFENGDLRLISIGGYVAFTPNADKESLEIENYGIRFIPETSDVILTEDHGKFQIIAREYAQRYNAEMLRLIKHNQTNR